MTITACTCSDEQITLSVGRDYRSTTKYEYVVFKGEEVMVRAGFFASAAKARREGIKAAQNLGVA